MSNANDNSVDNAAQPAAPMTPGKGLLLLGAVVLVVGGFIGINHALGIAEFWGGFLFLLYWSLDHMKFEKLPTVITGALFGLLLGYLLQALPIHLGAAAGGLTFLAIILVVIYCQIMGWVPIAVNMAAMLFLTVGTIPAIQAHVNFANLLAAVVLGIAYFVGLLWIVGRLQKRSAAPAPA